MRNKGFGSWRGVVVKDGKVVGQGPAASKYHNIPCEAEDGVKFRSKLEKNYYQEVVLPAYRRGEIILFVLQPSFLLAGGIRYRGDFLIVWKSGKVITVTLVDTKGKETYVYKMKRRLFNQQFPNFRITELK